MSIQTKRALIGAILIVFVILPIGIIFLLIPSFNDGTTTPPETPPLLDPIPPSETPPIDYSTADTVQAGPLTLIANASATGEIPHFGTSIYEVTVVVNVTNNGNETISNFQAIKMSVYSITQELLRTFHLLPENNVTISPGQNLRLSYQNNDTHFVAPFRISDTSLYARILVAFGTDQEAILTTPRIWGILAIE